MQFFNYAAAHRVYSSGMVEQEGEKPCQIISPQLNVGGHIRDDASNGDTDIMINNRKITKSELLMLKVVLSTIRLFDSAIFLNM